MSNGMVYRMLEWIERKLAQEMVRRRNGGVVILTNDINVRVTDEEGSYFSATQASGTQIHGGPGASCRLPAGAYLNFSAVGCYFEPVIAGEAISFGQRSSTCVQMRAAD